MTKNIQKFLGFICALTIGAGIFLLILNYLHCKQEEKESIINKNGIIVKAVVIGRGNYKGAHLIVRYEVSSNFFELREGVPGSVYSEYNIGDTILVKCNKEDPHIGILLFTK